MYHDDQCGSVTDFVVIYVKALASITYGGGKLFVRQTVLESRKNFIDNFITQSTSKGSFV